MNFDKLIVKSIENYYNPYREFNWPKNLPNTLWMSPELTSLYYTSYYENLTDIQKIMLSQKECLNFFSLNVFGIKDLILKVIEVMYLNEFEDTSEYFHHFIGEENEHMWFFAQFCLKYGNNKMYKMKAFEIVSFQEADIQQFVNFAKILIFEEIGDYFNVHMMNDVELPETVRQVNRVHHSDESRHIKMGRMLISELFTKIKNRYSKDKIKHIQEYISSFIVISIEKLYNPLIYEEIGIKNSFKLRNELISLEERIEFHSKVTKRIENYLVKEDILHEKIYI